MINQLIKTINRPNKLIDEQLHNRLYHVTRWGLKESELFVGTFQSCSKKVKCDLCHQEMAYHASTTVMIEHLKHRHVSAFLMKQVQGDFFR